MRWDYLHLDKSDNLARLPDYLKVLQTFRKKDASKVAIVMVGVTFKKQGEVEGDDGKEVDHVHRGSDELHLWYW